MYNKSTMGDKGRMSSIETTVGGLAGRRTVPAKCIEKEVS